MSLHKELHRDGQTKSNNLAEWMSELPTELRCLPIINLAIPGSHDSMTYGIVPSATVAPDAEPVVSHLYKVVPCVVRRWAKTQTLNVTQQLNVGIRYLDLRFSLKRKSGHTQFYFVHGLFAEAVQKPFCEIREFLYEHPREFIIMDCQHFYEFQIEDFERLVYEMSEIFGNRVFSRTHGMLKELTLDLAERMRKQVLIIFRHTHVPTNFWPSNLWPTPWPEQIKVNKLQQFLDFGLHQRPRDSGYVSQCVLTPPALFIVQRFYSSLRNTCATTVCRKLFPWINNQCPGLDNNSCNVFISDFVDLNDNAFCKSVVNLNYKLINEFKQ